MTASYTAHKEYSRRASQAKTRAGQDIGAYVPPVDPARKREAILSFKRFCELYFPERFTLAWAPDHLQVLARIQEAIQFGGLFALAMPRGSGKTTIAEVACLWALMTGYHPFVMLIAVSSTKATELLASIKTELLSNDLLHEDWWEVTGPVRALEDRANRAKGQHSGGYKTFITWSKSEVVLPTIYDEAGKPFPPSAGIVRVAGLTSGSIRGSKFARPDGRIVRPSLVLLDDPQDDESANSVSQCETRHKLVSGAVLGMAGPGKSITVVCPCTVIRKGDLSDRLLNREKSPQWTGQKFCMLQRFPERMDLWHEYSARRADEMRNDGDGSLATAWYGQHKVAMDAGAVASWPERFKPNELSAVQHAMNLYYDNEESFFAEYQNDPKDEALDENQLVADAVAARTNGIPRGVVPSWAMYLTAFVDVSEACLWWVVAAWSNTFHGSVIAYGTYPEQNRGYFGLSDVVKGGKTLRKVKPGSDVQGAIYAGLDATANNLLGRSWQRDGGGVLQVGRMLVDSGDNTETVKHWCRSTPFTSRVLPAKGKYVGPAGRRFSEYTKQHPGDRLGTHWIVYVDTPTNRVLVDTNYWKSFVADRLKTAIGDRGALTLYGTEAKDHRMFADQVTAEHYVMAAEVKAAGVGAASPLWRLRPDRKDNHWFDCLVGCAVAASMEGAALLDGTATPVGHRRERKTMAQMKEEAKRRRGK